MPIVDLRNSRLIRSDNNPNLGFLIGAPQRKPLSIRGLGFTVVAARPRESEFNAYSHGRLPRQNRARAMNIMGRSAADGRDPSIVKLEKQPRIAASPSSGPWGKVF
jgi:hypothetical protein